MHACLTDRVLLTIEGETTEAWLQDLVTLDMAALDEPGWHSACLLSPQGKVLFAFLLRRRDGHVELETSADQSADLLKRLTLYRLRAPITFGAPVAGHAQITDADGSPEDRDHRFPSPVVRTFVADAGSEDRADYDELRIAAGIAEPGFEYALGDAFPHDINLDVTGGLSFRKGCYVGQEVVSRTQHRGTARRRLVTISAETDLPDTGTPIEAHHPGGRDVSLGNLGTVVGKSGLAIIRIDRAADALAEGASITVGDVPVTLSVPEGAPYDLLQTAGADA